jgi:site-specific recombinase XerD
VPKIESAQAFNEILNRRFSKWLWVQRYTRATRSKYLLTACNFGLFLGKRKITTANHADIQDFLGALAQAGGSVNTLHMELYGLRSFFDFLNLGGLLNWVPPRMVRVRRDRKRVPRYLTRSQVARLLKAARTPRERVMLALLYGSGCRSSELVAMRIENVDFDERRIKVRGKAGTRYLLFPAKTASLLRRYIQNRREGYVFLEDRPPQKICAVRDSRCGGWKCTYRKYDEKGTTLGIVSRYIPRGQCKSARSALREFYRRAVGDRIVKPVRTRPLTYCALHGIVRRLGARVGIYVNSRILRHTIATHLMDNGADIHTVQILLGHQSIQTTQVYTHISQKNAQRAFEKCHPLN